MVVNQAHAIVTYINQYICTDLVNHIQIADAHMTHYFKAILSDASKSRYNRKKSITNRGDA